MTTSWHEDQYKKGGHSVFPSYPICLFVTREFSGNLWYPYKKDLITFKFVKSLWETYYFCMIVAAEVQDLIIDLKALGNFFFLPPTYQESESMCWNRNESSRLIRKWSTIYIYIYNSGGQPTEPLRFCDNLVLIGITEEFLVHLLIERPDADKILVAWKYGCERSVAYLK